MMKKLLGIIFVSALVAGGIYWAFFTGLLTESASTDLTTSDEAAVVAPVVEADFIALSAEILCLPQLFSVATETEIEQQAIALAHKYGISEAAYESYQNTLEADVEAKKRIGFAIIGKMADFCEISPELTAPVVDGSNG
jgi:hypothetical protein